MDQIQLQASKLWELLFSEDTGETYQNALNLTGQILKETGQLLWLIICSVFVFGAWVGDASMNAGNSLRDWIEHQGDTEAPTADKKPIAEKGKELIASGRTGVDYLLNQAREQLGLEPVEPQPVRKPSVPKAVSKPKNDQPAETTSAPTAATATAQKETAPEAAVPPPTSSPVTPSASGPSSSAIKTPTPGSSEPTAEITREVAEDDWPPQESEE